MITLPEAAHQAFTAGHALRLNSNRSLPGRLFEPGPEVQLSAAVERLALDLPSARTRGVILVGQMPGPFGVADFAALIPDTHALDHRLSSGVPPLLNESDAIIAASLYPSRQLTLESVAQRSGLRIGDVKKRVPLLRRSGAIRRTSETAYIRHESIKPVGRLHIFETKVRDLRRALGQAYSYASWSDSTTVVLDRIRRTSSALTEIPPWMGVVSEGNWLQRPRIKPHPQIRRLWASEHLVAALSGHHPSPSA